MTTTIEQLDRWRIPYEIHCGKVYFTKAKYRDAARLPASKEYQPVLPKPEKKPSPTSTRVYFKGPKMHWRDSQCVASITRKFTHFDRILPGDQFDQVDPLHRCIYCAKEFENA